MQSILVVNVGSTSLKFKLYLFDPARPDEPREVAATGRLEGIGRPKSVFKITVGKTTEQGETGFPDYEAALRQVLDALGKGGGTAMAKLSAIAFKPVHARDVPLAMVEMDEDVLKRMAEYNHVVPAHNPPVIAAVRSFRAMLPEVPLVGLFEPAFHATLAPEAYTETVPAEWLTEFGIRKYGFHGASHRYIAGRTAEYLKSTAGELRIVSCHLGGSSSLTAIRDGRSVETTMSFSAQSGLPQGTRCGTIDPFIPIFLMKEKGWSVDQVEEALAKKSGLLGLSGVSAEFREIAEAASAGNDRARRTIDLFVYRIQCEIARLTVPLGGMNTLVFTGGIGERSAEVRSRVCSGLEHLGVRIDEKLNTACVGDEARLERADSAVRVLVLPTDEELVLACDAAKWLGGSR